MAALGEDITDLAGDLRRAFDQSFAGAADTAWVATEDFLSVTVGGDPYALRLSEVAGFHADKKITPLPSAAAELIGVAGFRGAIVPVYDLGALLNYPASEAARWLVIAAEAPVALAFDAFEGHNRFAADVVASHDDAVGHVHQIVRTGAVARPIINIPSVVAAIRAKTQAGGPNREH